MAITPAAMLVAAALLCCVAAQNPPNQQDEAALPDGPGKAILKKSCSPCHTASVIITKPGHTDDEWVDILNKMIGRGAVLSDDDGDTLVQYLTTNFGPDWKGKPAASGATSSGDKTPPPDKAHDTSAPSSSAEPATVNVNKASAKDLQSELGLTADEAEKIINHREEYGNYKSVEDLLSVPGVTAEKIKENQKRLTF